MDAQQHTLPAGYAAFAETFRYGGRLKADCDAFGKPLESEISSILTPEETAAEGARELLFFLDSFDEEDMSAAEKEGCLKTLICFAADGAGNRFSWISPARKTARPCFTGTTRNWFCAPRPTISKTFSPFLSPKTEQAFQTASNKHRPFPPVRA